MNSPCTVPKSLVLPDVMALVMEPDLAPILRVEPQGHRLMGRDDSATTVAHLPALAWPGCELDGAVMWETPVLESKSDQFPESLLSPHHLTVLIQRDGPSIWVNYLCS